MPTRFTPTDILSSYAALSALNDNFDEIATLLDLAVMRDGSSPNSMLSDLDLNHFNIRNAGNAAEPTDVPNLAQVTDLISNLQGISNTLAGFSPGNQDQVAGVKAKIDWVRDDPTFPLENEGSIWPGAMKISHGISAAFNSGDMAAGWPGFGLFVLANNNASNGEVVAVGGSSVARTDDQAVFGGNLIARTGDAIDNAKLIGLEIDIEPAADATNLSNLGRGLEIAVFNKAVPFPAIHIGSQSGGSFDNGLLFEGLASTAAGVALGASAVADSLINGSTGTFTTSAVIIGEGATKGLKWFTSGGANRGGLYFDGTNIRVVMPNGGTWSLRNSSDTADILSVTDNGTGGTVAITGTAGQVTINGSKVLGVRNTGWTADTGTARKAANVTYTAGSTLTYSAAYVQAEQTAMATRMASVEAALQNFAQTQKALKDALIAHGLIGA